MLASVAFYCYWDVYYFPLLATSVVGNFLCGRAISNFIATERDRWAKIWLAIGIFLNLSVLFFFKYFNFFLINISNIFGFSINVENIALPIGISFFTFTQIAYLVDSRQGKVKEYRPESYGLFVTYFPHLIAGPILHHKDMMPQFDQPADRSRLQGRFAVGMIFFCIGLFKKIVLADGVARYVSPVFDIHFSDLTPLEAWAGALAYTFQLYFDFSAYSDMAYGLSYLFGIILPINFNSPYRSTSIIEFWRRWHITLSTFLRDYLYIPLGGNRSGKVQRYINLMVTMLLGGLWHGANWTFVVWGALHGFYLIVNHVIRGLLGDFKFIGFNMLGGAITFFGVVVAWVFFRANSFDVAIYVLKGMFGGTYNISGAHLGIELGRIMDMEMCLVWLAFCASVAFLLPNVYELLGVGRLDKLEEKLNSKTGLTLIGACISFSLFMLAIGETRGVSEFLYFNF